MPSSGSSKKTYVVLDFAEMANNYRSRWQNELSDPNQIVWIDPNKGNEAVEQLCQVEAGGAITYLFVLNAIQSGWLKRTCQINRYFLSAALAEETTSLLEVNKVGKLSFAPSLYFCLRKCNSDRASRCVIVDAATWTDVDVDQFAGSGALGKFEDRFPNLRLSAFDYEEFSLTHLLLLDPLSSHGFGDAFTSPKAHVIRHWKGFKSDYWQTFHDLLRQEFANLAARERFVSACERTFPHKKGALERAIYVLRLCRRIVTWTLEGAPFQCTIFLADERTYNNMWHSVGNIIAPLFEPKPATPFLFPNLSDVRDLAEMIQSEGLMLHVNIDSGAMDRVLVASVGPVRGHFWKGRELTKSNKNSMVIHMRDGHFVELYAGGRLELQFDGFAWQTSPYESLERTFLEPHFDNNPELAQRLTEVIASLLNQWKSSIIILLHASDEFALESLRTNNLIRPLRLRTVAEWDFQSTIERIPSGAVEGILKLDGAHVINSDGKILHIAQTISDEIDGTENSVREIRGPGTQIPTSNAKRYPGTGTNAARSLSGKLKNSTIIKVSASGNLKVFKRGELVQP